MSGDIPVETPDRPYEEGDLVWGNYYQVVGLAYRAEVVAVNGHKLKVQPLEGTLTEGSTRVRRDGPLSRRVRWVKDSTVQRLSDHDVELLREAGVVPRPPTP